MANELSLNQFIDISTTDVKFVKQEVFDPDIMRKLLIHDGISKIDKGKLKRYSQQKINGNNIRVIYDLKQDYKKFGAGRLYCEKGLSLQAFERDIRGALAQKYYHDLDVENAHPTILLKMCDDNGWRADKLKYYVENREQVLKDIQDNYNKDREQAKKLMNSLLYLNVAPLHDTYTFLCEFRQEMYQVCKNIWDANHDINRVVSKKKKNDTFDKKLASCASWVISTQEDIVLINIHNYLISKERLLDVFIYDGCLVRKLPNEDSLPNELITGCVEYVKEKTGYDIKLKVKPLTTTLELGDEPVNEDVVDDDYAAEIFCSKMGDRIKVICEVVYVFDETTGIWTNSENVIKKYVKKYKNDLIFKRYNEDGKLMTTNYGGFDKKIKSMLSFVGNYAECDNDFFMNNIDSSKGKLIFSNGIYDFSTDSFTEGFDPKIVSIFRIKRPFRRIDESIVKKVHKVLFEDPFTEEQKDMVKLLKIALALAVFGEYNLKKFYMIIGLGNAGKGLLCDALKGAFDEYVGTFMSGSLVHHTNNTTDLPKQLSWIIDIMYRRIALANEAKPDLTLDGNRIKGVLASGGDPIVARKNNKDEGEYINRSTAFLFLNDVPKISPYDDGMDNRTVAFEYNLVFTPTPDPNNPIHRKEDNTLRSLVKTPDYADALVMIIIDAYQMYLKDGYVIPKSSLDVKKEWITNQLSLLAIINERYEKTDDENDAVPFKEIEDYLVAKGAKMSAQKMGRELTRYGFPTDTRKVDGKSVKVRKFIKRISAHVPSVEEGGIVDVWVDEEESDEDTDINVVLNQ